MNSDEVWLSVVGYEGLYEVSDQGRVRSINRITSHGHRRKGLVLRPTPMRSGYLQVNLWRNNVGRMALVHRLVLTAFVGPSPEGQEGLHRNGHPADNALRNLAWGTHSENQLDQVTHGTHANAAKDLCPSGHPYDELNTYVYPGRPHRGCRTCRRRMAADRRAA